MGNIATGTTRLVGEMDADTSRCIWCFVFNVIIIRIIKGTSHIVTSSISFLMLLNDCPSSSFDNIHF